MSKLAQVSDDQWHKILDNMDLRQGVQQPAHPSLVHQPALPGHASDQSLTDFAFPFNPVMNAPFDKGPTNYGEAELANFGAHPSAHHVNMDETSLAELQKIAKELEGVKERLERRSKQIDKLLENMRNVFAHLAEIQPFLTETRNLLKDVVSRVDNNWEGSTPAPEEDA